MKYRLFALLLCLSILLSGCSLFPGLQAFLSRGEDHATEATTEPEEPTETTIPDLPDGTRNLYTYVPYTEFEREYTPYETISSFSDIQYERPDAQSLCDRFAELQKLVEDGATASEVLEAYEPIFEDYLHFDTMSSYAYIRYTLNLNDSYFDEEYNWCQERDPEIKQAQEKCYIVMAKSDIREELEADDIFGEDFFDFYDENEIYSNDRVVELMQQESELQSQYMALQSDMTITWQGEERLVEELLATLDYEDYLTAYRLYYEKYNPICADLYIQLIGVRKEIAAELGYESYADFAYDYTYQRDYSPEDVEAYCDAIAEEMSDLLWPAMSYSVNSDSKSMDECLALFADAVKNIGGAVQMSYDVMQEYDLYDVTESTSKMPGSYMTYLNSYELPFVYISPNGTLNDFLTVSHEFGHFVDGYVNCGGSSSIDCAEIYSQGLEFLALEAADLKYSEKKDLLTGKFADSVMVFLGQACYAEFEHRAFAEENLTAERLNELYMECNNKFGMGALYMGVEDLLAPGWIDIQHFFIAPYYVISYCVSNDVSLQIYQAEDKDGSGLDLYYRLLNLPRESKLLELMELAEMASPLDPDRVKVLADFLDENLN